MDNDNNVNTKNLSEKEKADLAGRDVAEIAARAGGRYYGGNAGGAAVDFALKTKGGQRVIARTSKKLNRSPAVRKLLAKSQGAISQVKPMVNSAIDSTGPTSGGSPGTPSGAPGANSLGQSSGVPSKNTDFNKSDNSLYRNSVSDKTRGNEQKGTGNFTGNLFGNKSSLMVKLIIGVLAAFLFISLFVIVLISPLMSLGIINIDDIGSSLSGSVPSSSFTSVKTKVSHYWPVGSNETSSDSGVVMALGNPSSTDIITNFDGGSSSNGITISSGGNESGVVNVIATKDGTVVYPTSLEQVAYSDDGESTDGDGYGNYVMINHNDGTTTLYAHLSQNSVTVIAGDTVKQGQIIGKIGSSGNTDTANLYFEVIVNGNKVDPTGYIKNDNPRPQPGGVTVHNGSSNKQSVCLTLKSTGFSDDAVAAILTNIKYESSFDTKALGDNGTSYGLCQWHNGRYDNLKSSFPNSYSTVGSQIEYLMYELENQYVGVFNALSDNTMKTEDLTYKFCANFEVPYDTKNTCRNRANNSADFYNYVKNGCN